MAIPCLRIPAVPSIVVLLLFLYGSVHADQSGTPKWKPCGGASKTDAAHICNATLPAFNITNVQLTPLDPVPGRDLNCTLIGVSSKEIANATLSVSVYYMGIPVYNSKGQLCNPDDPGVVPTGCPITLGNVVIINKGPMPDFAPPGSYSMRMVAHEAADGAELMCVDVWFRIGGLIDDDQPTDS